MNESSIPGWLMNLMVLSAIAQLILLICIYVSVREWAGILNRKLHRIESNTRHAAEAAGYVEKEPAEHA